MLFVLKDFQAEKSNFASCFWASGELNGTEMVCSDFKGKAGLLLIVNIQCRF